MTRIDLKSMSDEELWELHEEIAAFLTTKIQAAKLKLEKRLGQIQGKTSARVPARRPYPKVYPKFRNPDSPHQTWSGRGLQPRWLRQLIENGKSLEDFRI